MRFREIAPPRDRHKVIGGAGTGLSGLKKRAFRSLLFLDYKLQTP
ncbi:hypothetical protein roselon_00953 [Roseibacterium elongatum DSM 19469]|uniref:Uncharacterized protein n=1 Tax=Roseicyclus elongatus DSM 19469 TaxID=1294273 RepID=W8RQK0_9RHOB|nr:hypothetical protein roselon_00953 [Roseibacterium elongatum DSM 19469]